MLLWGHYVIPNWYIADDRVAYWDKFGKPKVGAGARRAVSDTWWIDAAKAAKLGGKGGDRS